MLLAAAATVIVAWFAGGTIWNVRRGGEVLRWLQPALKLIGDRSTLRWLGSTAVELVMADPRPPFSKVTIVVFLEPRDMPWMWAFSRRKDTVIVRGELRAAPRFEIEVLDTASWSGRDALPRATVLPAHKVDGDISVWSRAEADLDRARALLQLGARAGLTVRRLSIRASAPQLQLHVDAPRGDASASALFESVRELAERAVH